MTYEELRSKMLGLGIDVDRVLYYRAVDGGRSDRVEGVAYNLVDSGEVLIVTTDGRLSTGSRERSLHDDIMTALPRK